MSNSIAAFADEIQVVKFGNNILTLDSEITDIIGGKNVKLNMSLEVNDRRFLPVGAKTYIKYTLDGSSPENGEYYHYNSGAVSPQYQECYTNEINLTEIGTYTLRAIAESGGYTSEEYTTQITIEKLNEPTIIVENNALTLKTNIDGAAIYYTTDGSEPTTSSAKYTESILLKGNTLLQAIAVKEGYVTSDIAEEYILYFTECSICGREIGSSQVTYDEDDNPICKECANKILENENEGKCQICREYFKLDDMLYDEDDNLICQDCYDELQNEDKELFYIQCPYCEKTFEDNEDIYDEDGYAICPYCDEYIDYYDEDDEDEEINEIECPHCNKSFEETDDVYDEYGYIRCPYCDGYILTETEYYEEIEFITSDWAEDEVYEAYQNNLIPDEMLKDVLYNTVTREEFAAIAVKLYENLTGEDTYANIKNMPFTDCNTDSKYISYIAVAYKLGITNGTTQTTFSPYDNISREELATMLYRVIKLVDNNKTFEFDVNNVRKFFDDSDISDYAKESVYFMAEYGIVKGVDGAHFAPLETATKEQSLLITVRCVNNLE